MLKLWHIVCERLVKDPPYTMQVYMRRFVFGLVYYPNYKGFHRAQCTEPTPLALDYFRCVFFLQIFNGDWKCSRQPLFKQITHKAVPWMAVGRKMLNIVFYRKVYIFSNRDYSVQNLPFLLQTGFKWILKGWKCVPQTHWSRDMGFLTMWYVRPAKPQVSLRISAVGSEPLLVA